MPLVTPDMKIDPPDKSTSLAIKSDAKMVNAVSSFVDPAAPSSTATGRITPPEIEIVSSENWIDETLLRVSVPPGPASSVTVIVPSPTTDIV